MTQEDKELLLKDLCARLPYGVKVKCRRETLTFNVNWFKVFQYHLDEIKPYLRPMSSMTEEENKEFWEIVDNYGSDTNAFDGFELGDDVDWLNTHHFDYRGLIEKGLALEAPEGMYQ